MIILLPIHILIALGSIFYAIYVFFRPSKTKLNVSYVLVALTLATGTVLVALKPGHMQEVCVTGLVYLGITLTGIFAAHHKLVKQKA